MLKINVVLLLMLLFCLHSVSGVIIQGVDANQDEFSNGELIELTIYTNQKNLQILADFSNVDSKFNKDMVLSEETEDFAYKVWYPITFGNVRGDNIYNAVITAYDQSTDTSSVISYGINLNNENRIEKTESTQTIRLKVRETRDSDDGRSSTEPDSSKPATIDDIKIEGDNIVICRESGCSELTEEEYENARRIIIDNNRDIQLSNMTYQQLKTEVLEEVNSDIRAEINQYINQIIQLNKDLKNIANELEGMIQESEARMSNSTNQTQHVINQARTFNIASVVFAFLIVGGGLYLLYLKQSTTWLS